MILIFLGGDLSSEGFLESWEIILLIIVSAIFLGGIIAMLVVYSIKYRKNIKVVKQPPNTKYPD